MKALSSIINKSAAKRIIACAILSCLIFAARGISADAGFTVIKVETKGAGAPSQVWIDAGARDGVSPGMKLELFRGAASVGTVEITEAGAKTSSGYFEPGCPQCAPVQGDIAVRFSGSGFTIVPPPILIPEGTGRAKQPPAEAFEQLEAVFRAFASGEFEPEGDVDEVEAAAPKLPPPCPAITEELSDISTEFFPSPGDRVRVSGFGDYVDFCLTVDALGYLRLPDGLNVRTVRTTLAAAERDLNAAMSEQGLRGRAKLSLMPPGESAPMVHYYVSGSVVSPGVYEAESGLTVGALIARAGGPAKDSDGTALVVEDLSAKWNMKLLKPEKLTDGTSGGLDAAMSGGVVFLPSSPENLNAFINEILMFLSEQKPSFRFSHLISPKAFAWKVSMTPTRERQ